MYMLSYREKLDCNYRISGHIFCDTIAQTKELNLDLKIMTKYKI